MVTRMLSTYRTHHIFTRIFRLPHQILNPWQLHEIRGRRRPVLSADEKLLSARTPQYSIGRRLGNLSQRGLIFLGNYFRDKSVRKP